MSETNGTGDVRDLVLGKDDLRRETVEVEEWETELCVRELSTKARIALADELEQVTESGDEPATLALIVVRGVVDEDGEPVFRDEDVDALLGKSMNALNTVAEAVLKVNGFAAEDLEEAEGN